RLSYGTDSTMFTLSLIRGKDQAYRMERSHSTFRNDRLRQARIGRNWRQHDLAEELGTTVVTVKRWERGYQQPSPYFRVKLCALFGTSAEQLGLVEEDSSSPPQKQEGSGWCPMRAILILPDATTCSINWPGHFR